MSNNFYSLSDNWRILKSSSCLQKTERVDWVLTNAGLSDLPYKGKGQLVGVLDTGCDDGHKDLKGNVKFVDFVSEKRVSRPDTSGHGTFVTGQIVAKENGVGVVGVAPEANALSCRVIFGDINDIYRRNIESDLAKAIRHCADSGCKVINMSLGGAKASREILDAINYAVKMGVIPVAAAGNERMQGLPFRSYPASFENVISVSSANKKGMPAFFSSIGVGGESSCKNTQPEIAVASLEFYHGCLPRPNKSAKSPYGVMIGTSMAAPIISGALLLWLEALNDSGISFPPEKMLEEARKWLRRVAVDTNQNGWDPELGFGVFLDPKWDL